MTREARGLAVARLLIVHGMGDHIGRYGHLVEPFADAGVGVSGLDLRGNGRSGGRRGDFADFNAVMSDFLEGCRRTAAAPLPWFVYGHSFGGLLAIRAVQQGRIEPAGVVLTAPWLRLALDPPRWKRVAANWLRRMAPAFTFGTGITKSMLGADGDFVRDTDLERLGHAKITVRAFLEAVTEGERALAAPADFRAPLLVWQGDRDSVMDWRACEAFVAGCGVADRTFQLQAGIRHEPQNDSARGAMIEGTLAWLLERAAR